MRHTLITLILCLSLLGPAVADSVAKGPLDYPLKHYGVMLGTALLGGLVSWYARVRRGEVQATSIMQLVGELCTSAFAGLLAFWVCEWAGTPPMLEAALVGISGHMGTRAISAFEEFAQRRLAAKSQ